VINHGISYKKAMQYMGACISYQALWERVAARRRRVKRDEGAVERDEGAAAATLLTFTANTNTMSTTPSAASTNAITPGTSAKKSGRKRKPTDEPNGRINSAAVAKQAVLELLPEWSDRRNIKEAIFKQKRRSTVQVNRDNFEEKALKDHYRARLVENVKGCSLKVARARSGPNEGKWGNDNLTSPNKKKLSRSMIDAMVDQGDAGKTPTKKGRRKEIESPVSENLAKHAVMMQLSREGEASKTKIISAIQGLTAGIKREGIDAESLLRRTWKEHAAMLNPSRAKKNKDRRVDWLTFKNITEWSAAAKKLLFDLGMVKDEPGIINGEKS